jgi:hypothetical protein
MRQTPSQEPAFCGAPATRGRSIPGAASANELISRTVRQNQNDENECSTQDNDLALGASASRTDRRGHPNTGGCRQTMYETTFVISDNKACPQETDPGHDALRSFHRLGTVIFSIGVKANKSESSSVGARHRLHPLTSGAPNS